MKNEPTGKFDSEAKQAGKATRSLHRRSCHGGQHQGMNYELCSIKVCSVQQNSILYEAASYAARYDTVFSRIKKSVTARVISESWNQSDFCS